MAFVAHAKKERQKKYCMGLSSLNSTALKFIHLGLQQNGDKTRGWNLEMSRQNPANKPSPSLP